MGEITFEQLEAEVRRLAAEKPDFVYESNGAYCYYNPTVREGREYDACIFGQAFANLGSPIDESHENMRIDPVLREMRIGTFEQQNWACSVQAGQDKQNSWGEAVRRADRLYPQS